QQRNFESDPVFRGVSEVLGDRFKLDDVVGLGRDALLFKGPPDVKVSEDIHQDILDYIRTVSLQQIEGPRGFQYLKDDIQ
ncbi:hypothetical protein ACCS53_38995, partial [Rhizobium ruizarguesonis]